MLGTYKVRHLRENGAHEKVKNYQYGYRGFIISGMNNSHCVEINIVSAQKCVPVGVR